MEHKTKSKKTLNIPKNSPGAKKNKEYSKLIPFNIPNAKQVFFFPEQSKNNIVLINDLETLNDSSFTNNFECLSNKDQQSLGDSISLIHSKQGSKSSLNEEKNKINKNNKILQEELIKKDRENILLKKEITDLKKNMNLIKDKESAYQKKFLKMNENYNNLEKMLTKIKNEYNSKEKELLGKIGKLKDEIKYKNSVLNSLEEKISYKNQIIQNLNNLIKIKAPQMVEFNNKINENDYLKKNKNYNINNNSSNKENENHNNNKNIRNSMGDNKRKNINLEIFFKKHKLLINKVNSKTNKANSNLEDKSTTNIYQRSIIHQSGTNRNQGVPRQINNYNYIDDSKTKIPKKSIKDISLKKQIDISKKIFKIKHDKNKSKNSETNNSVKNISNLKLNRNYFRQYSNIRCFSYTNKINDPEPPKLNIRIRNNSLSKRNNLIKEENPKEVFLKRLYKNNKKLIKTSINDSTNSYNYISDSGINQSNFNNKNKKENKSYELNLNEYAKNNYNYRYNNTKKDNNIISSEIGKSLNQKHKIPNYRKSNIENIRNNYSSMKENHSVSTDKNNIFFKDQFRYQKPRFNYTNSLLDYN